MQNMNLIIYGQSEGFGHIQIIKHSYIATEIQTDEAKTIYPSVHGIIISVDSVTI